MAFSKFLVFMFALVLTLSFISAVPPVDTIIIGNGGLTLSPNLYESVPVNTSLKFHIHVFNTTTGAIITTGITCGLHIYNEFNTGDHVFENDTGAILDGLDYEWVLPNTTFITKGEYSYKAFCNTSDAGGFIERSFYVTKNGQPPANDTLVSFIYLLFIISTIGLITTFFLTIAKLVTFRETIFGVLITWSFVMLNMFVNFLSSEYLLRTSIENFTEILMIITRFSNGLLPVISLIITMFVIGMKKKKPLTVKEITGGGRLIKNG